MQKLRAAYEGLDSVYKEEQTGVMRHDTPYAATGVWRKQD